ncbi:hypothetical protein D9M73_154230 [compost metagenome]
MRGLWLADREAPAQPARRGRSAPEPVQSPPARAVAGQPVAPQPGFGRTAPDRLRRTPLPGRPGGRAIGQRKPYGPAPARRCRPALVPGDDGDHGYLARIQYRPEPGDAHHPALGRAVFDHAHRVLQLYAVFPGCRAGPAHPPPDHGCVGLPGHRRGVYRGHLDRHHRQRRVVFRRRGHVRPVPAGRALS